MVAVNRHKTVGPTALNIVGLTEEVTPDTATDYLAIYDASVSSNRKVLLDNLGLGGGNSFGTIQTDSGTSPVADSSNDTLTLTTSLGLTTVGTSGTDTVSINLNLQSLAVDNTPTSQAAAYLPYYEGGTHSLITIASLLALGSAGGSGTPVTIPSIIPTASAFSANQIQYYMTEDANGLNFKMKYADGTIKRAVLPIYGAPDWATVKKYALDGVNDYLTSECTGIGLGIAGASAFTVSLLVDFDMVANDEAYWFSLFSGTGTGKMELYRINSAIRFIIDGAYTDIAPTRINGVYHLVFVYDGSLGSDILRAKIYHNGTDATTTGSGTIPATVNTEIVGSKLGIMNRYAPVTGSPYDGDVREISIWNRALTSAEVTTLYNSGSYSDPTAISGCVSSWWFGDNPSDNEAIVVDNIGKNHLTGVDLDSGVVVSV